ncbi:MAG: superoxide dismutase [Candidatus Hodarchaeales archaeon]
MKIIAIEKEKPDSTPELFKEYSEREALEAWDLYQEGFIREMYFRADKSCAILILESNNLIEANDKLQLLPFVKRGLISFDLIPLKPYTGFSRLFKTEFISE